MPSPLYGILMRFLAYLFLSLTIFGAQVWAEDKLGECEKRVAGTTTITGLVPAAALTLEQAEEILGPYNPDTENGGGPGALVRKAIQHLISHEQYSVPEAIYNLEVFLKAIRYLSSAYIMFWKANRITSVDGAGTVAFVGDAGHAIAINTEGEVFRGEIYIDKSRYVTKPFTWNGDYSKFKKMGQIKLAPAAAASP